jgi:hypothetical protein
MEDTGSAVACYEERAEFLRKMPAKDLEVILENFVFYWFPFGLHR